MDRSNDIMSAEAQVLHAALDEDDDEVDRRLAGFTNMELRVLADACTRLRAQIGDERERRRREE